MAMIVTCSSCLSKNRLPTRRPAGAKFRCGKCKRDFSIRDLSRGVEEAPKPYTLEQEDDQPADDGPTFYCKDEDNCGWEGPQNELEITGGKARCPDCGKGVRSDDDD